MGCLRQYFRPKKSIFKIEGVGNCWECTEHADNKNCRLYYKITAPNTFEVKEKEDERKYLFSRTDFGR